MKVFASWSGDDSKSAAELFRDWLPNVLQEVEVWVSSRDIARGDKSTVALWDSLTSHDFGIVLLTQTNFAAPWILFESGALSKAVKSKVVPILLNINRLEIANSPLNQLQNITTDMFDLVLTLNERCERSLPQDRLRRTFDRWWPDLEEGLKAIDFKKVSSSRGSTDDQAHKLDRIENGLVEIMNSIRGSRVLVAPPPVEGAWNTVGRFPRNIAIELVKALPAYLGTSVEFLTRKTGEPGAGTELMVRGASAREISQVKRIASDMVPHILSKQSVATNGSPIKND